MYKFITKIVTVITVPEKNWLIPLQKSLKGTLIVTIPYTIP